MTKDDIIRMAVEAGFAKQGTVHAAYQLEAFAFLVAAAERDRNTKMLYQMHELAAAQHNYYKHAAIEINRKARSQS